MWKIYNRRTRTYLFTQYGEVWKHCEDAARMCAERLNAKDNCNAWIAVHSLDRKTVRRALGQRITVVPGTKNPAANRAPMIAPPA